MSQSPTSEIREQEKGDKRKSLKVLSAERLRMVLAQSLDSPLTQNEIVCVTSLNESERPSSRFESFLAALRDRDSSLSLGRFQNRISALSHHLTPSEILEILESEVGETQPDAINIFVFPWTPWSLEFAGSGTTELGKTVANTHAGLISIQLKTGIQVNVRSFSERMPFWKRLLDISFSSFAILLVSPVFLAVSIAIKLTSRGPVFFRQQREGKDGVAFEILKFRTMFDGAEYEQAGLRSQNELDGPAFKIDADPRLTPIGKWLRLACIDELPQFINVLKGDMSVVGPRPLPVEESRVCSDIQRRRLEVTPGMTCYWQVSNRKEVSFDDWMKLDLKYVKKRSFNEDIKLIWRTVLAVLQLGGSG